MNRHPIDSAHDPDLRHSLPALRRAAQRARDLARQTGTTIVIRHNGVLETVTLPAAIPGTASAVHEPPAPDRSGDPGEDRWVVSQGHGQEVVRSNYCCTD